MSEATRLTVNLNDICVHLGPPNVPVMHRAVYPAGRSPQYPNVLAHSPTLEVPGLDPVPLNGATVTFSDGAPGATFTGFPLPACVPHLKCWFPWLELSDQAINGKKIGNDGQLGAYIDFWFGNIAISSKMTTVSTRVEMEYPEDATSVQITITPWAQLPIEIRSIVLPLPATVTVSSSALEDTDADYTLALQIAKQTPATPTLDAEMDLLFRFLQQCCCTGPHGDEGSTVGCSNSQFP